MRLFALFSVIATAYCCTNNTSCNSCITSHCQFALLKGGKPMCAPKITPNLSIISIAKKSSHCEFFDQIGKVSVTSTTPKPTVFWHLQNDSITTPNSFLADRISNGGTPSCPPCIQSHPSIVFTTLEMFLLVPTNATCKHMIPEFRYLRCLCSLNRYHLLYENKLGKTERSYLELNPSKRFPKACEQLEKLRFCNVTKTSSLIVKYETFEREPFPLFANISSSKSCNNTEYIETAQETVVKLLCRMEHTATSINWYNYAATDFAFFSLRPSQFHKQICRAVLYRRK